MAFNFKVYESTELTVLGVLATLAGTGAKLRFTKKSLNGTGQLCVVITKANGTSDTATCSKAVTAAVRNALAAGQTTKQCLGAIVKLSVIEGENGGNYISAPMNGEGLEDFTIAELKAVTVSFEELVAF